MLKYTEQQLDTTIQRTLEPSQYVSYLPLGDDWTSPSITAGVPTAILILTTIKYNKDFIIKEISGQPGAYAVHYLGAVKRKLTITVNTGMQTSVNNVLITLSMYKNGVSEPGIGITRKVGTGTDTGALGMSGVFEMDTEDYIQVYLNPSLTTTVTLIQTSISIVEVN